MTNKQIVKVNETHSVSIREENGIYEVAHLLMGEYSETLRNDVERYDSKDSMEKGVQELVADIVNEELELLGYDTRPEVEQQVVVEGFTYNTWVAVVYYDNKLSYGVSTIHCNDEDFTDRNVTERKTWKGLINVVQRFYK